MHTPTLHWAARASIAGFGIAAGVYGVCAAVAWLTYGTPRVARPDEADTLLDTFMPQYEVAERHSIRIAAPAGTVVTAAKNVNLFESTAIRTIIKARELVLGATGDDHPHDRGLIDDMQAMGWRILAEVPNHEIVVGAVTKPWEPNVVFRPIPPEAFAAFAEPGYVKILWTLRADPLSERESLFRTETRATTTDAIARARFRRYWSIFSPGIVAIRWLLLAPVKANAEPRATA